MSQWLGGGSAHPPLQSEGKREGLRFQANTGSEREAVRNTNLMEEEAAR